MSEKLTSMKCIHLNPEKDDIEKYFYKRNFHKLYTQPKYNGIRALWYHEDGLYSRGGHLITSVPHIVARLETFFPDTDLDGELYHPTMPFNDINGAARRIEPSLNSMKLEYHVFDRLEGMVVRAPEACYRPGRHVGNLWAIKPVYEVEATFLGFLPPGEDTSLHQSTFGSLLLKLPEGGRTFSCSGISEDEREKLWNNPPKEGTLVTVKFGAWSSDHPDKAVPLFPRFKAIRWDK
jgi:ATP-dependent DNA ligase